MMYGNKLAAAIKVNGKVLREFKDTVYIPFASEYTILLKNLNTVKVIANVYIDGNNAVPGGLVINPGQEIDLERWIKNGNLTEGNKFKFIERTGAIEQHRGIKLEDGLVRVEYQFEQPRPVINIADTFWKDKIVGGAYYGTNNTLRSMNVSGSTGDYVGPTSATYSSVTASGAMLNSVNVSAQASSATMDSYVSDVGITVPGSKSTQTFVTTHVGILESTVHNIVLRLVGDLGDNKPVEKAVTVKHKPKCVTCGKQNKAHAKFCTECGTALEIFA